MEVVLASPGDDMPRVNSEPSSVMVSYDPRRSLASHATAQHPIRMRLLLKTIGPSKGSKHFLDDIAVMSKSEPAGIKDLLQTVAGTSKFRSSAGQLMSAECISSCACQDIKATPCTYSNIYELLGPVAAADLDADEAVWTLRLGPPIKDSSKCTRQAWPRQHLCSSCCHVHTCGLTSEVLYI